MRPVDADLSGRVCVVTGASAGIGLEVARGLAREKAHVILACRDPKKGAAALASIKAATGTRNVELRIVDLALQASIRSFAEELLRDHPRLHVLVNNAGVWLEARRETGDGLETTWATNVLGYFLTTRLLLGRLRESAPSRIVNVASTMAGDLDLGDVEFRRRRYAGVTAYRQSKQADRLLTWALARRLAGSGVTAAAVHPGGVSTELFRKAGGVKGAVATVWARFSGKSPAEGADSVLWLAASAEAASLHDVFVADRAVRPCQFRGPDEDALWELCERMTRDPLPALA